MRRLFSWLAHRPWYLSLPLVIFAGVATYLAISNGLHWANPTGFCEKPAIVPARPSAGLLPHGSIREHWRTKHRFSGR